MQVESIFIVHPDTSEQASALKAFIKVQKMKFEVTKRITKYNPEFVKKIKQGEQDFKNGNFKTIKTEDLWNIDATLHSVALEVNVCKRLPFTYLGHR